ncbi:MAG: ATP-binding protein [Acidobacteriota bacterium]|nr:ATP-binding protein [Acidobacteriota bacterium]
MAASGIPERYCGCTLDNFKIERPERAEQEQLFAAREQCWRYVESFLALDGRFGSSGLLFVGNPGVGKTHLAVAVLKELVTRYHVHGRFEDFTALIHRIQATFEPGTVDSKHAILRRVTDAELLVLDDLGAQKLSDWVTEILYLVINTRYNRKLPTIFTTNLRLEAPRDLDHVPVAAAEEPLAWRIPARLLSRLYEMATPVAIVSADFRRSYKMPRLA